MPRCRAGKAADCPMSLRMIREIKVSCDWFGCVLVKVSWNFVVL